MKAERVALAPAYLLHQYSWRETSRILEVWSRTHGRLGLVARGVRRAGSPYRSLLQPFYPLLVSWSQRGELGTLVGVEAVGGGGTLHGRRLMAGFYLNELILRLLPRQDAQPYLYDAYAHTLQQLAGTEASAPALRVFEKHLLASLGYGLNLDHAVTADAPIRSGQDYVYDLDSGPIPASSGRRGGIMISGRALLALQREQLEDVEDLKAVKRLLSAALRRHLGDQPLKTAAVMRALTK
jgi:DNA repair protein RecO (recombination protein O)